MAQKVALPPINEDQFRGAPSLCPLSFTHYHNLCFKYQFSNEDFEHCRSFNSLSSPCPCPWPPCPVLFWLPLTNFVFYSNLRYVVSASSILSLRVTSHWVRRCHLEEAHRQRHSGRLSIKEIRSTCWSPSKEKRRTRWGSGQERVWLAFSFSSITFLAFETGI